MIAVAEIEAAIPKLSRAELDELRRWFDDYVEEYLELSEEAAAALEKSKAEIAAGNYLTRQP